MRQRSLSFPLCPPPDTHTHTPHITFFTSLFTCFFLTPRHQQCVLGSVGKCGDSAWRVGIWYLPSPRSTHSRAPFGYLLLKWLCNHTVIIAVNKLADQSLVFCPDHLGSFFFLFSILTIFQFIKKHNDSWIPVLQNVRLTDLVRLARPFFLLLPIHLTMYLLKC